MRYRIRNTSQTPEIGQAEKQRFSDTSQDCINEKGAK
jgi:hypothetical protein